MVHSGLNTQLELQSILLSPQYPWPFRSCFCQGSSDQTEPLTNLSWVPSPQSDMVSASEGSGLVSTEQGQWH